MTLLNSTDKQIIKSTWLVGASTGIGASLISALDEANTQIFVSARHLNKIKASFPKYAARIIPIELDVIDEASVSAGISKMLAHSVSWIPIFTVP